MDQQILVPTYLNSQSQEKEEIRKDIRQAKQECDKAYSKIVLEMANSKIIPESLEPFMANILTLYVKLEPEIPFEKQSYKTLLKLREYSRNPYKLNMITRLKGQSSVYQEVYNFFSEFVEYYFTLLDFLHDTGITRVSEPRTGNIELLASF